MRPSARTARFVASCLWVHLDDGRIIAAPLAWFARLLPALPEERERFELSPHGIHWEHLDEDISIEGLLAGHGDLSRGPVIAST